MISIITAMVMLVSSAQASEVATTEASAIKAMAGCYKVTFDFKETEKMIPNYPISSEPYHAWGYEWITVDNDSESEIHLQHILITPNGPMKHWRQEWKVDPSKMMSYKGDNYWETSAIEGGKNVWLQRVYQVDDSPRYECAATWEINSDHAAWGCKAWSPLPRREFSKRSDYNVLNRGNFVVVNKSGWAHHQRNDKVLVKGSSAEIIAREVGVNTYEKIDDEMCVSASTWWSSNQAVWHDIQSMWKHIFDHHPNLKFRSKVDNKVLWMHLFELADTYAQKSEYDSKVLQKEAHDIIHKFLENHE